MGKHTGPTAATRRRVAWLPLTLRFVVGVTLGALGLVTMGRDLAHSPVLSLRAGGVLLAVFGVGLIVATTIGAVATVLARRKGESPQP